MNPRQRRGALLIVLSTVGAVAVFVMVANYVGEVRSEVGPVTEVLALADRAAAHQPITEDLLRSVEVPERWMPSGALTDARQVLGRVAPADLPGGTVLQDGMLVDPPEIAEGHRELAIMVDAETGVGGKIGPGSVVDVVATFSGDEDRPREVVYVIQNAEIIEVGSPTEATEEGDGPGFARGDVVPVTFNLDVEETLRLAYVETFADNVRLALRSPVDGDVLRDPLRRYAPEAGEAFEFDLDSEPEAQPEPEADRPDDEEAPDETEPGES